MTKLLPPNADLVIRPVQYTDLELVNRFCAESAEEEHVNYSINPEHSAKAIRFWQGPLRVIGLLLNRPHLYGAYLTEQDHRLQGMIQISAFNRTRSTWRVDRIAAVNRTVPSPDPTEDELAGDKAIAPPKEMTSADSATPSSLGDIGSLLLRYCFETTWEARTWLLEVNVNYTEQVALYRQNGFQPLAHMTYWQVTPELLRELAEREPDLPNLLPVSNADAQLLYQLDTMSMPPLVRQVFDRHVADFRTSLVGSLMQGMKNWLSHSELVSGYVFEPQRKAAIGHFQLQLCRNGTRPHQAQLTVNPAYTWLYPEIMSQVARITQDLPVQALHLASSDYQPEREEYLERIGANRVAHTLMMSRSIWHKVRESKLTALENLQLPEVLQGLQPSRKAIPSRISLLKSVKQPPQSQGEPFAPASSTASPAQPPRTGLPKPKTIRRTLTTKHDFSGPPPEGPCC